MERFSERQCIELALIWALALILLYALVLSPFLDARREEVLAERTAAEVLLARVDDHRRMLLSDARAEEALRARQVRVADALPEEHRQGAFIHTVERLAHANGVTIEGFVPQENDPREGFLVHPMELHFRGRYFDVLSFLHAVQEEPRAVAFGAISVTSEDGELRCVLQVKIAALAGSE